MMDVRETKRTLKEFQGSEHICDIFKKTHFVSDSEMEVLWDNYLEFMIVMALCHDAGSHDSHKGMLFSTTRLMDELWHCLILEMSLYDVFMVLVRQVNPMMDKIHHSSGLALTPEADKIHRRKTTAISYRLSEFDLIGPVLLETLLLHCSKKITILKLVLSHSSPKL